MKRVIGAAAAGVVAFSGIYALAASLNVTTNTLGAGTTTVAACQAGAVNVTYPAADITYSATLPGYNVTGATVTGVTAGCYAVPYQVTLYGAGGVSLASATGTTASAATFNVTFGSAASVAAVTNVAVVLGG